MAIELPEPIAAYFGAETSDASAVVRCFTPDAVVEDEGKIHRGRAAIESWKAETSSRYKYTSEPFAISRDGDWIVVSSHTVGDFPGSPIDLRAFFRLADGKIAALTVRP